MSTSSHFESGLKLERSRSGVAAAALWKSVRLSLVGILMAFEPAVRYIFCLAMVLGIFSSVVFEISAAGPRFPFLGMLAFSLGFGVILFLYYGLITLLSR